MIEYYDFKTEDAYSFAHKVGIKTSIKGSEWYFKLVLIARAKKIRTPFR